MQRFLIVFLWSALLPSFLLAQAGATQPGPEAELKVLFAYVEAEMAHQHSLREQLEQVNQRLSIRPTSSEKPEAFLVSLQPTPPPALKQTYETAQWKAEGSRFGSALRRLYRMSRNLEERLEEFEQQLHQSSLDEPAIWENLQEIESAFDGLTQVEFELGVAGDKWLAEEMVASSPWAEAQRSLLSLSLEARQIGHALQTGTLKSADLQPLRNQLQQCVQNQAQYLAGLPAHPGSQRDPALRYRKCLRQAHTLLAFASDLLAGLRSPPPFQAFPPAYFCYHHQWGRKFDALDQGLRGQIGQFLGLASGEPIWPLSQAVWWEALPLDQPQPELASGPRYLVLVVDRSGSMHQPGKLTLLQNVLPAWLESLSPEDRIAMVSYADGARLELDFVSPGDSPSILQALEGIRVGGSSQPRAGLELALDRLDFQTTAPLNAEILLLTDGGFRIDHALMEKVSLIGEKEIGFRLFYLGRDESRMRRRLRGLAAYGQGRYAYLHTQLEPRLFSQAVQ